MLVISDIVMFGHSYFNVRIVLPVLCCSKQHLIFYYPLLPSLCHPVHRNPLVRLRTVFLRLPFLSVKFSKHYFLIINPRNSTTGYIRVSCDF